jgi:transposase-like protein
MPEWAGRQNGKITLQDRTYVQKYLCKACGRQFNERTGTPMARLRTWSTKRGCGNQRPHRRVGSAGSGRDCGKSHSTIIRWEKRLADSIQQWSPSGPSGSDVTLEGMKCILAALWTFPRNLKLDYPFDWTGNALLGSSRTKQNRLFEPGTASAWAWAKPAEFIRWRGDGERRYGTSCSKLASVALKAGEADPDYGHRKVWRQGLEVAMKIKGSQGKSGWSGSKLNIRLRRSVLPVMFMPITAEAQNSALRRRSSAYRRRQNLSAKRVEALQRVLSLQRLVHNWVRPHWGLEKK